MDQFKTSLTVQTVLIKWFLFSIKHWIDQNCFMSMFTMNFPAIFNALGSTSIAWNHPFENKTTRAYAHFLYRLHSWVISLWIITSRITVPRGVPRGGPPPPPEFGRSVNPFWTRVGRFCPPPGFKKISTPLVPQLEISRNSYDAC